MNTVIVSQYCCVFISICVLIPHGTVYDSQHIGIPSLTDVARDVVFVSYSVTTAHSMHLPLCYYGIPA